jgi:eukaryotic-like serine/threonine-protein kinase
LKPEQFRFGEWQVSAADCTIRHCELRTEVQIEPRAMDVLVALCANAGVVLGADELLHLCWDGVTVGENQVHKAVTQLRRALGDRATAPRYIENIRKRGYRTIAEVTIPLQRGAGGPTETWSRQSHYVGLDPRWCRRDSCRC